jgi:hypothetical protein
VRPKPRSDKDDSYEEVNLKDKQELAWWRRAWGTFKVENGTCGVFEVRKNWVS